jgi:hypothetical protein
MAFDSLEMADVSLITADAKQILVDGTMAVAPNQLRD